MICVICRKRKASRYCPAKSANICSIDCGTEREVTIDCPAGCPHLVASRQYEEQRHEIDWSNVPFADIKISPEAFRHHEGLLDALGSSLCVFADENRPLVDADALAVLQSLGESYQTLTKGIYYEKPLDDRLQRELYTCLKELIAAYKKEEAARMGSVALRDETVRDALIFLTQVGATRSNGRPKGRAYLDFLRGQFKGLTPEAAAGQPLLILP